MHQQSMHKFSSLTCYIRITITRKQPYLQKMNLFTKTPQHRPGKLAHKCAKQASVQPCLKVNPAYDQAGRTRLRA